MTTLREQAALVKAEMMTIVDRSKAAARDLTDSESNEIERLYDRHRDLTTRAEGAEKAQAFVAELAAAPTPDDFGSTKAGGSRWAKSVMQRMTATASGLGVKALLTGQIDTPPAVEVVALPDVPTTLLDLIPRASLNEQTFSYLRQTVKDENADVVADNATKPTSVYTFEEIEDRARVVAHLSEPFPLRYLTDHASMMQVLDGEMRTGVMRALEAEVVAGDGTGEHFTGILTTTGTTGVTFSSDVLTTVRKARTALESKGESATAWVFHPNDVEGLDLMREDGATGGFLMNSAAYAAVFGEGVQRVTSLAVPEGTALLGDWRQTRLRIRENVQTLAATQAGDLFDKNQAKLRSEGRFGFELLRPQAMAVVDLTA